MLLYPGVIYGPGKLTAGNVVARMIIERFNGRLPGYIGPGTDRYSFSHVDDVVDGHIGAMSKGRVRERYLLTGENGSFKHRDLSNRVYAAEHSRAEATEKAEAFESGLGSDYPTFVKPMLQSHVTGGFWMVI